MNDNQHFLEAVKKSQNVLISARKEIEGDIFCGALALFYTLNKLGKNVNLFLPRIVEKLKFLATDELLESVNQGSIIISINTRGEKIEKILYEKDDKELKFSLGLKDGDVSIENISFKMKEKADLIINLEGRGVALEKKDASSSSPLQLPMDNRDRGFCGNIFDFLKSLDEKLIDKNTATCLLAGLILKTQNFQNAKTSPMILEQASYLITQGADHQKIIQFLYKTKSLPEVKILSKVLSLLNFNAQNDVAWCSLSREDFTETGSSSLDLPFVFEALKSNFSMPKTIFILWEENDNRNRIKGILCSEDKILVKTISEQLPSVAKENCAIIAMPDSGLSAAKEKIFSTINNI